MITRARVLLDSNIIIYSVRPQYQGLRDFVRTMEVFASDISYVEALGFHRIGQPERQSLDALFSQIHRLPLEPPILDAAVALRQKWRMSLGDALVAATALVHDLSPATHNVDDF